MSSFVLSLLNLLFGFSKCTHIYKINQCQELWYILYQNQNTKFTDASAKVSSSWKSWEISLSNSGLTLLTAKKSFQGESLFQGRQSPTPCIAHKRGSGIVPWQQPLLWDLNSLDVFGEPSIRVFLCGGGTCTWNTLKYSRPAAEIEIEIDQWYDQNTDAELFQNTKFFE